MPSHDNTRTNAWKGRSKNKSPEKRLRIWMETLEKKWKRMNYTTLKPTADELSGLLSRLYKGLAKLERHSEPQLSLSTSGQLCPMIMSTYSKGWQEYEKEKKNRVVERMHPVRRMVLRLTELCYHILTCAITWRGESKVAVLWVGFSGDYMIRSESSTFKQSIDQHQYQQQNPIC